ncbi:(deoxy)nucleoside triphosphate pyrophosphohydrolase [Hyphococcus luteus]|uniref:8-oxo-dGTP diphosphatase n=1 Tax=Hyphococcus luteus TaxID=2058213 RepID=A0A2S7K1X4_9PROT|nr:(deoxy)nucleoside triphosphate pyrophosphohydrolase [Marinicaulis flavus]PQA86502.1 8-oxo-dGTP diphosphatase MutT [Marinicaulis flavus]
MAKLLLVAACALIDRDGKVLMARRPDGKDHAGLWEFPGGKLAEGETPEAALVRELREELAIDTEASCLAPAAFASEALGDFHLLMPLFVCRKWKGAPRPLEGQELRWVRREALTAMEMPPADRPLAAQLRDLL